MKGNPVLKAHLTLLPQFLEMPSNPLSHSLKPKTRFSYWATKLSIKLPEPALLNYHQFISIPAPRKAPPNS